MTEKEKMLAGKLYDPFTPELVSLRKRAHKLCREYNLLGEDDPERAKILAELVPDGEGLYLQGPINLDYGCLLHFGKNCYANFNFTAIETRDIYIGDNVYFGPNVTLASATHPLMYEERNQYLREDGVMTDREYGRPIRIGSNCWIASGVIICGGAEIGDGCVIGAGSVVTHSIPAGTLAAGNPCNVIRKITEADSVYLKKELF